MADDIGDYDRQEGEERMRERVEKRQRLTAYCPRCVELEARLARMEALVQKLLEVRADVEMTKPPEPFAAPSPEFMCRQSVIPIGWYKVDGVLRPSDLGLTCEGGWRRYDSIRSWPGYGLFIRPVSQEIAGRQAEAGLEPDDDDDPKTKWY